MGNHQAKCTRETTQPCGGPDNCCTRTFWLRICQTTIQSVATVTNKQSPAAPLMKLGFDWVERAASAPCSTCFWLSPEHKMSEAQVTGTGWASRKVPQMLSSTLLFRHVLHLHSEHAALLRFMLATCGPKLTELNKLQAKQRLCGNAIVMSILLLFCVTHIQIHSQKEIMMFGKTMMSAKLSCEARSPKRGARSLEHGARGIHLILQGLCFRPQALWACNCATWMGFCK